MAIFPKIAETPMKKLMLSCLLAAGAPSFADVMYFASDADTAKVASEADAQRAADTRRTDDSRERSAQDAKVRTESEDAKTRAKLDEARARLEKAAREVAELSTELNVNAQREVRVFTTAGPRRAILGVNIDPDSGKEGARVRSVSPGGPAAEAGLVQGDVIVAIDGKSIAGKPESGRALVDEMHNVKPDQKVKVRVLRQGKNKDLVVVARPMVMQTFDFRGPEMGTAFAGSRGAFAVLPQSRQFHAIFPGEFQGLELTKLTPKLGAYFGTTDGVLVVQAPENDALKLEDGDVIQSIDGRKPDDGAHALRILRSYKSGEKLTLAVLRQKKPLSLAVTMPERPEGEDSWFGFGPDMPLPPPVPDAPLAPIAPQPGPGSTE